MDIGDSIPGVSGENQDGESFCLERASEAEYLLVFFFPRAKTPGCTKQSCSLRDANELLVDRGVEVVGVSRDSARALRAFSEERGLPYALVSDRDKELSRAFGVPSFFGFLKRQAFLFRKGRLVWLDRSASTSTQADDVLAEINRIETS